MAKAPKTLYTCTECGGTVPKWQGKCPHCGEWNTLQESLAAPEPKNARFQSWAADSAQVVDLSQVSAVEVPRQPQSSAWQPVTAKPRRANPSAKYRASALP